MTAVAPSLEFRGVATSRTTESAPNPIYIVPISGSCGWCDAFNADTSVTLAVNTGVAGIVTITPPAPVAAANADSATAVVSKPTAGGTYTLSAAAAGFGSVRSEEHTGIQPSRSGERRAGQEC